MSRKFVVSIPLWWIFIRKMSATINPFPVIPLYVCQYLIDTMTIDLDLNGHITNEHIESLLVIF